MNTKTLIRSLTLLAITLGAIAVYILFIAPSRTATPTAPDDDIILLDENPYAAFHIPDFTLTDQRNNPITHDVLQGELTVVDFFFTSCPLYCPGMTNAMRRVQDETEDSGLRFLSISIDGHLDTPAIINDYAQRYSADPERWIFATGDPDVVHGIVMEGLKFDLGDPKDEDSGRLINHPTRLILVGPDRKVLGLYRYDDPQQVNELIADAKAILDD